MVWLSFHTSLELEVLHSVPIFFLLTLLVKCLIFKLKYLKLSTKDVKWYAEAEWLRP